MNAARTSPATTHLRQRYGPWAVVTGASSGIGAELARQLARHGLNLVLAARRADRLAELGHELAQRHAVQTVPVQVDLAEERFLEPLRAAVAERDVGLLVNAAGFALTGPFLEQRLEQHLALLAVNCRAPLVLSHYFGQAMVRRGKGGIIFLASTVAYFPTPWWADYAASKAFDRFLGQALGHELRAAGVDVLILCPGFTQTEFLAHAGVRPAGGLTARVVAERALRDLGRRSVSVPGAANRLATLLARLAPEALVVAAARHLIGRVRVAR